MNTRERAMGHHGTREGEAGIALFYALLVVLLVGGIVAVTLASAQTELRQSAFELDFEDTVHVAEAGVEAKLQQLPTDNGLTDPVPGPAPTDDEHDWAVATATATDGSGAYVLDAIDTGEGETVAIRPTGANSEFVYGVGFTPSREAFVNGDGEPYVRVVRVQVGFTSTVVPGLDAVQVDGSIKIDSNAYKITGTQGSLHANGVADISKDNTDEGITYSGSCVSGSVGTCEVEPKDIPLLEIEDPWGTDEAFTIAGEGDWYDYCGGSWYLRGATDTTPCSGTLVVGGLSEWSGLSLSQATDLNRVYWIDDPGTVQISKVAGPATVIARGDIVIGPSANVPAMTPRYPGLWLFTESDLDVGGNAEGASDATPAIAYARGTLTLRGTMNTDGIAFIAKDAELIGSAYKGGGEGIVNYNGGAAADLGGDGTPLVLRWEELRP